MKLIRNISGIFCLIVSLLALFKFDELSNIFLFLSPDKKVELFMFLLMRLCFISLSAVGLILLFYNYFLRLLKNLDTYLLRFEPITFMKYSLLTGFILRSAVVLFIPFRLWGDWECYDDMGWQWTIKGGYYNGDHLTGYWPPAYPFFLSRLYLIFGHIPVIGAITNIFFSLAIPILTYFITKKAWDERVARWAMVIIIFFPSQIMFVNLLATEMLFTSLLLLSILIFINLDNYLKSKWYYALGGGILLGIATLTRPVAKYYLVVVMLFWFIQTRELKRIVKYSLIALIGFSLVVVPWMVRNYYALGSATINTNTGINLYIGNQPSSGMGYNTDVAKEFDVNQPGMEAYIDSVASRRAWAYILEKPVAFIKRGVLKVGLFYATDVDPLDFELIEDAGKAKVNIYLFLAYIAESYYFLILLAAFLGFFTIYLRKPSYRNSIGLLFWLTIIYWTGIHFVFFGAGRFHFPIIPMFSTFAALFIKDKIDNISKIV